MTQPSDDATIVLHLEWLLGLGPAVVLTAGRSRRSRRDGETIGAVALLVAPALWILLASDSSRRSS